MFEKQWKFRKKKSIEYKKASKNFFNIDATVRPFYFPTILLFYRNKEKMEMIYKIKTREKSFTYYHFLYLYNKTL